MRCIAWFFALGLLVNNIPIYCKAPAIPETKVRILYKETGKPAEWACIYIQCFKKLGWMERRARGYDEERIYKNAFFTEAKDGWVLIPAVDAPGTTEYEIHIQVPGCNKIRYSDLRCVTRDSLPFNNKTLPRFLQKPLDERVLYAAISDDNSRDIPVRERELNYEGIRYGIAEYAIDLEDWPIHAYIYTGLFVQGRDRGYDVQRTEGPYFRKEYCWEVGKVLDWGNRVVSYYEKREKETNKYPLEEINARVQELRNRIFELVCADIQNKKVKWGGLKLSKANVDVLLPKDYPFPCLEGVEILDGNCNIVPP